MGFGDFSITTNNVELYVSTSCVCLTNNGLLINTKTVNTNIKLENRKKY